MTFRELITSIRTNLCHNPDWFGETVLYNSANGIPRLINVHVTGTQGIEYAQEDTETQTETIWIKALKDTVTGIDRPAVGDSISRYPPYDQDPSPYVFVEEVESDSVDAWRLRFDRHKRLAQGFQGR